MGNESKGWIGCDLDGTLAVYDGWKGAEHIGDPIPLMMDRVKRWVAEGREVKIFTARVSHDGSTARRLEAATAYEAIGRWQLKHFGYLLAVTNAKDYGMIRLYDDRCVQVEANTGRLLCAEEEQ